FLDDIFETYIHRNEKLKYILQYNKNNLPLNVAAENERGMPADRLNDGWWKMMFLRYALAMHFSKDKKVLESCSGLGWGAFLLEDISSSLTCIEIDQKSIEVSQRLWPFKKTRFVKGSVLSMPFGDGSFDVVSAMENIEHFELENIKQYLDEVRRVLKPGGILVGSSFFADNSEEARKICQENKHHLHICTKSEISVLLKERFKKIKLFANSLFFWATD
ncbi:unnamed protein product, partial [marine sediment metagenome]